MTPQPSAGRNGRPHSANDADGYSNAKLGGGSSRVEPRGKMDLSKKLTAPEFRASTPALPAFTAFLADTRFEWDLSLAIVLPVAMAMSIALSVDPRVSPLGASPAASAALGSRYRANADAEDIVRRCELPSWAARDSFPCGASMFFRVLHVFYHMPWYTLVRPARLGDWATVLSNGLLLGWCAVMGVLSASRRSGPLWARWRRWRSWVLLWAVYLARSSHLALAFLLLPPPTWTTHSWTRYLTTACTNPVLNTLMLGLCDQVVKVPLPFVIAATLLQSATTFVLAYRVAPNILTLHHHPQIFQHVQLQHQNAYYPTDEGGSSSSSIQLPVPLQCGVRPEHATLLSCRPLPLQLMIGVFMLVWPVWVSWHVERRLRKQHAAVCDRWRQQHGVRPDGSASGSSNGKGSSATRALLKEAGSRRQSAELQGGVMGLRIAAGDAATAGATGVLVSTASGVAATGAAVDWGAGTQLADGSATGLSAEAVDTGTSIFTPHAKPPVTVRPIGKALASQPRAHLASTPPTVRLPLAQYQPLTYIKFASIKVRDHPGSYEEYSGLMAAAAPAIAKAALMGSAALPTELGQLTSSAASSSTTTAPTSASGVLPPLTVVRSAVIHGCVQLVAWARGLRPDPAGAGHGLQDGGGGEAAGRDCEQPHQEQQQQQQLRALVASLPQMLPSGFELATEVPGSGLDMGVSVQVGSAMAAAGPAAVRPAGSAAAGLCGGMTNAQGGGGGVGHGAAKLLQFSPAALAIPQAKGPEGDATVVLQLLLHSPTSQPGRLLLLADRGEWERQQQGEQQQQQQHHLPSQLLAEVPVEMIAGTQVVDLALGPAEVAAAVQAARCGAVGVLQLVLVGPEHNAAGEAASERTHAYPLVHWVAPPLLLLPPAAAAELCVVWEAMQLAAEAEEGAQKRHVAEGDVAGIEHESALWWRYLAPLLGDMAYAFGDQVHGDAAAMEAVSAHLLPYLYDNGLPETAALLQQQLAEPRPVSAAAFCSTEGYSAHTDTDTDTRTVAVDTACCIASSTSAVSPSKETAHASTFEPRAALQEELQAAAVTPASSDCSSSTCRADPPTDNDLAPSTANGVHSGSVLQHAPASSPTRSPLSALLAHVRYLLPPAPFSPPAMELSYHAWRLSGMAAAAPYVLLLTAQPVVLVVLRMAREQDSVELVQAALLAFLGWITDACSSLILLCMRGRIVSNPHASPGAAAATASVVRQHYLAAVLYGPAVLLLASLLMVLRVVPFHALYVGSVRLMLMCTAHRSVVLPSIRQLLVREKWNEAPLLALGEAVHVCFMQPLWGWPAVLATVLVWRLGGVLTAAIWERRSRRRFAVMLQRQHGPQPGQHLATGHEAGGEAKGSVGNLGKDLWCAAEEDWCNRKKKL